MRPIRHRLRRCLWIVLLAVCGLSVIPTVSRLLLTAADGCMSMPMDHATGSMESMMADGSMHGGHVSTSEVPVHGSPTTEPPNLDRCDLCVVAALAVFAAPEPAAVAGHKASRALALVLQSASAERRGTWTPAAPRGPPVLGI